MQTGVKLATKNLGTQIETSDVSLTNKIPEIEERISGIKDKTEEMDASVKENVKSKNKTKTNKLKTQAKHIQGIWDIMKRPKSRKIEIKKGEETQVKAQKIFLTKA